MMPSFLAASKRMRWLVLVILVIEENYTRPGKICGYEERKY